MHELDDIFGPDGPLQRTLPDFRVRREQLSMAERVAGALAAREPLVVEAGTGTGKTFAYLVPALLSGMRVLISTGTRTLQDQLFSKDLPLVAGAIGVPARVALLKGRANYLCRYRLARTGAQLALEVGDAPGRMLGRIERWARTTRRGDLAEVSGLSDSHPIWPQITSTRDNCLGARCPDFSRCHVVTARREAQEADVVIVNHHLLLADLALKEDGFGDLLGSADAVILDEAHQIADLATQFFGASVGGRQIDLLLKDVQSEIATAAAETTTMAGASAALRGVDEALRSLVNELPRAIGRYPWDSTTPAAHHAIEELAQLVAALGSELEALESQPALAHASKRAAAIAASLERISSPDTDEGARTVEIAPRGFTLGLLPFDISSRFQGLIQSRSCSWIFTSATLSVGEDFGHFTGRLGLGHVDTLQIPSPFNYEGQGVLLLPEGLPAPSSPQYVAAVIDVALPLIEASRGGAFVLFTSHRALSHGAALLRARWGSSPPFELYVQGDAPREQLLHQFRGDGYGVLLGTASFWEGVDVKGQALRLVVIEKLPFASPDDPIVKARIEYLQSHGGNAFRDYQLPEAALALKQGVGRLVRSEEDHGVVALCDPRIVERGYGRVFVDALPPFRVTREVDDAVRFLRRHSPPPRPER
ncbi:MAG: ATP-dependent DNA helicase, partial [Steroidobacteraceae bacterium]